MTITLKTKVNFPASVTASGGLKVVKANGAWTVSPNWTDLALETSIPSPAGRQLWTLDPATGTYYRLSVQALIDNLPAGPTGPTGATGAAGANGAGYGGTSATSLLIANSTTKVFATQAGLAYQVGNYVRASSAASGANFMEGLVTAYGAGSLSIAVSKIGGSGTFADWNFAIAGAPGTGDLLSTNNLSDVANAATARGNLGAAPLASPAFTGTPTAPTAAVDTNTTQLATTAMVLGQAASATPIINGTAAVGTSTRFARADHVHPTDTTRAALAGNQNLTGGFTATSNAITTVTGSNQTITANPLNGNIQDVTLDGSSLTGTLSFVVPSSPCSIMLELVNGGSGAVGATLGAGSFTKADISAYDTTNGNKFLVQIIKTKNYSYLGITALQ